MLVRPVTEGFFRVLGKAVALGRSFEPRDAAEGGVILSDAGWRRLFNADPSIVGSAVTLDDRAHVIVGVAAAGKPKFTSDPDLFTVVRRPAGCSAGPVAATQRLWPARRRHSDRHSPGSGSYRRSSVRPAVTSHRVVGVFACRRSATLIPGGTGGPSSSFSEPRCSCSSGLRQRCQSAPGARAPAPAGVCKEIRGAIGGGRGALIRLLIVEGAVLAVVGGAAGLLAASWTLRGLPSWIPPDYVDRGGPLALDARVYLLALLVCR